MGTEILRPQDCLFNGVRVSPAACSRRRYVGNQNWSYNCNYNAKINRKPVRSEKKRSGSEASITKRSSSMDDLVMEKVKILRRGESLGLRIRSSEALRREADGGDLVVTGMGTETDRLGPDLEMVPRQIQISRDKTDMYAGSAFAFSPPPSSLPLPSFPTKKQAALVYDSATRDLRRLLRLDL